MAFDRMIKRLQSQPVDKSEKQYATEHESCVAES